MYLLFIKPMSKFIRMIDGNNSRNSFYSQVITKCKFSQISLNLRLEEPVWWKMIKISTCKLRKYKVQINPQAYFRKYSELKCPKWEVVERKYTRQRLQIILNLYILILYYYLSHYIFSPFILQFNNF